MSRNLTTSSCCGNILRLSDLRGKPIEFRKYYKYAPRIGTKWTCPTCSTVYFAIWRSYDKYSGEADEAGRFVIDLSYYESYNDEHHEHIDVDNPAYLCTDNAEENQWIW